MFWLVVEMQQQKFSRMYLFIQWVVDFSRSVAYYSIKL